jgi:crotonobetaine/carnitine-CoA ligase
MSDTPTFSYVIEDLPPTGGVVFGGRRTDTPELVRLARQAAGDLHRRGIRPGDRFASMMDNGLPAVVAWFAAALAGAEYVPINTRLRADTLRYIVENCGARLALADAGGKVHLEGAGVRGCEVLDSDAWMQHVGSAPEARADAGGGCMIYTSGTTGRPKGVRWSAQTQARHAICYAQELVSLAAGENGYSCLPLFHVTCMGVTMASLIHGATVHIDPRFSVSTFWHRLSESQAVFFPYVGTILSVLLKDERPTPTHRVRSAMGAAAPADVFERFEQRFGVKLLETWGQTETASIWLANRDRVPGSIGRSCARADFRVAPIHDMGAAAELQVRPHDRMSMMSGYHEDPQATAAAWDGDWYRTRDLVTVDAQGNFYFAGRLADCLRRRGENVSAYEVEQAVLKHPDVLEAAVVGVDAELGEQDIALYYVEREPGRAPPRLLAAWCRERLGDFMVPRFFCPVDEFPKTETQRVQKGILHSQTQLRGAYDAQRKEMSP